MTMSEVGKDIIPTEDACQALLQTILAGLSASPNVAASNDTEDSSESDSEEAGAAPDSNDGRMERDDGDTSGGQAVNEYRSTVEASETQHGKNQVQSQNNTGCGLQKWRISMEPPVRASTSDASSASLALPCGASKLSRALLYNHRRAAKEAAGAAQDTAGDAWFHMKTPVITPEVKQDWRLLRLRAAYDSKRFYKGFDDTKIPKHFEVGTLVEGTGEFYSGRLTRRERKATLTEELLADVKLAHDRKRRFEAMQQEKQYWAKQRKKMKSNHKRSAHRPKH